MCLRRRERVVRRTSLYNNNNNNNNTYIDGARFGVLFQGWHHDWVQTGCSYASDTLYHHHRRTLSSIYKYSLGTELNPDRLAPMNPHPSALPQRGISPPSSP